MKHIAKIIVICCSFLFMPFAYSATSPVGYWKTIDDVTNQPKSILQIFETPQHVLYGRIMKIWPSPGKTENEVCDQCKGDRHNKRIVGMIIMEGLRQSSDDPSNWSGGTILDPKNGNVYRCLIQVNGDGTTLNVRGYVGMSLFGRTQTWLRVSGPHG